MTPNVLPVLEALTVVIPVPTVVEISVMTVNVKTHSTKTVMYNVNPVYTLVETVPTQVLVLLV